VFLDNKGGSIYRQREIEAWEKIRWYIFLTRLRAKKSVRVKAKPTTQHASTFSTALRYAVERHAEINRQPDTQANVVYLQYEI
jgi:hypothetical protein